MRAQLHAGLSGNAEPIVGPSQARGEANVAARECVLLLRGGAASPHALGAPGHGQLVSSPTILQKGYLT